MFSLSKFGIKKCYITMKKEFVTLDFSLITFNAWIESKTYPAVTICGWGSKYHN